MKTFEVHKLETDGAEVLVVIGNVSVSPDKIPLARFLRDNQKYDIQILPTFVVVAKTASQKPVMTV